jgi:membrane protease YdiL (CAAX protease family)
MKNEALERGFAPIIGFLTVAALTSLLCASSISRLPIAAGMPVYFVLQGVESASPALAAIVVMLLHGGKRGLKRFLAEKYFTTFRGALCLVAFLAPMILLAIAKALSMAFTPSVVIIQQPSVGKAVIIAWALIAEELGWRGFLQERVERLAGAPLTPLIIGVVWGLWHFHYFMTGAMNVPFWALLLVCVFESYGYFVITKHAQGNIIPASVWHFSGNLFINLFALNPDANGGNPLPYITATFVYGLCVIGFVMYIVKAKKNAGHGLKCG